MSTSQAEKIKLTSTVPGTVTIRRRSPGEWSIRQRVFPEGHDNNQSVTWVHIRNEGRRRKIRVRLTWATWEHMALRRVGYLKHGRRYEVLQGDLTPTATLYEFVVPKGDSWFGSWPWYSNDDGERFLSRTARRCSDCEIRTIGQSGEGRDIQALTIGSRSRRPGNVVVIARTHANECSGSFAVEGAADCVLRDDASEGLLDRYAFHFFPIVNPDGVANGLKLTRMGPVEKYDIVQGGMTSDDPTIRALREELDRLQPAVLISHHSYLNKMPYLGFFEKSVGLALLEELLPEDRSDSWMIRQTGPETRFLRYHCYDAYGSTVVFTELPWQGRLPEEIRKQGRDIFLATLRAHERKTVPRPARRRRG